MHLVNSNSLQRMENDILKRKDVLDNIEREEQISIKKIELLLLLVNVILSSNYAWLLCNYSSDQALVCYTYYFEVLRCDCKENLNRRIRKEQRTIVQK